MVQRGNVRMVSIYIDLGCCNAMRIQRAVTQWCNVQMEVMKLAVHAHRVILNALMGNVYFIK